VWERLGDGLAERDQFVAHLHAGADPEHYLPIRLTTELAWQALYGRAVLIRPPRFNPADKQVWQVIVAPGFACALEMDAASRGSMAINFARRRILLTGPTASGDLRRALFLVQGLLLPEKDVLPMRCAASMGEDGRTALFFGQTGSGKTTLAMDASRHLIGDDAHAWSRNGVFNLEGGCQTGCADLSPADQPLVWNAIRFGALLENVSLDELREPDYAVLREGVVPSCAFPLEHLDHHVPENRGNAPSVIVFLTCDLSGVLPLVARLDSRSAVSYFLCGYSMQPEAHEDPPATGFSVCFADDLLPRPPRVYAELLLKKLASYGTRAFLVNTGWTGSPERGRRIPLAAVRSVIGAILKGDLNDCETTRLALFNLEIPASLAGVDAALLAPAEAWQDEAAYTLQATRLAQTLAARMGDFADLPKEIVVAGAQAPTPESDTGTAPTEPSPSEAPVIPEQ